VISASVKFIRSSDKGVPPAPGDWATFVAWIKGVFIDVKSAWDPAEIEKAGKAVWRL